jgi:hypothetical protein
MKAILFEPNFIEVIFAIAFSQKKHSLNSSNLMLIAGMCRNIVENISNVEQGHRIVKSGMVVTLLYILSHYYELGQSFGIICCVLQCI